jgi:sigma-B regulation protein RsbU (phosphoserine phosphatase)
MKFPIRTKLILAICLTLLPVYLAVLVIDYRTSKAQAIAQMKRHLTEGTARLANEIDVELTAVRQTALNSAALMTQFPLTDETRLDALLRSNVRDTPAAFGAAIAYEPRAFRPERERFARYACRSATDSRLAAASIPYDYGRWDWYLLPKLLDQPTWTDPYFDEGAGNILMCTCSAPFYRERAFRGVVTVDISLARLREKLSRLDTGGGRCMVVSRAGTFVSHPNEAWIMGESIFSLGQWHQSPDMIAVGRQMIAGQRGVQRLSDVETGVPIWIVYAPIPSVGWSVAAVIPESQVMSDVYARLNRQAALLLTGLGTIVFLLTLVATWITRPIARLAGAAQELAQGNLEVQLPAMRGRDEIAAFAGTFNLMIRQLKQNIDQRIRETAAREAIERELQVARQIQTSLMPMTRPPFPDRTEFALDAHTEPAKIMAGDFFDFWFVDHDVLALVVADVSGKGVPAAMFMAVARTILRSFSVPDQSPAQVLATANRIMTADSHEEMFVTVFYAHYHVRTGALSFVNAGHNPPYIVRATGEVASLGPSTGPIVGVWDGAEFEDGRASLSPGDSLIAFTDGVTEARDAQGVLFGERRLEQLLATLAGQRVDEVSRRVFEEVNRYRQGEDQDDVTLLVLKREST